MKYKKFWLLILTLSILGIIFILLANQYILALASPIVGTNSKRDISPPQAFAIVFGGGMKEDGVTMSEMQEDRVKKAVELYKAGKALVLLMTGDDGANNGNEVAAMKKYAMDLGVPENSIQIDPHGYNTYKSCDRAVHVYGVTSAIVISQSFHLPRIEYFCSHEQGMYVIPVAADLRDYGFKGDWVTAGLREWLARVKAVVSGNSEFVGNVVVY